MSAWSSDISKAPQDKQILFRHESWPCPAVVQWNTETSEWVLSEDALADIDGGIVDPEGMQWAELPE